MLSAPRSKMLSKAKAKAPAKALAKPKAKAVARETPLAAAARRAREALPPTRRPPGSHGCGSPKQLTAQTSETSAGSTPKHLELEEKADRAEILEAGRI